MSGRTCPLAILSLLLIAAICPAAQPAAKKLPAPPVAKKPPLQPAPSTGLLAKALAGPLSNLTDVLFTTRSIYTDPHWYANFGYWSEDETRNMWADGGSRLCRLNLRTKQVTTLIDDPKGTIRDAQMHYDGKKILFSYRKGDSHFFHLYEMDIDGKNLRQITHDNFDDIEPAYLPSGDIVFCSSRCKRWVNCWYTQVAIMYRCDADGGNIHPISGNTEQDNTPAVLPDGRLLYTRWEYVDRSQVEFHHLWVANPDGTCVATYYGNMNPGVVMIDSRPIPNTNQVLSIFSPGHGIREHLGTLTIVTPESGPDTPAAAVPVKGCPNQVHDPVAITQNLFLVARRTDLLLIDAAAGQYEIIHSEKQEIHEPLAIMSRPREPVIPDRVKLAEPTGRLVLSDVYLGRNMEGVKPGDIRKLLVLESLPKPINFSGGPEPLTYLGTFTLERVFGTVPIEPDGSAYIELPANRQFFFVALDKDDLSVKRMQSWISVMPGETTGCVGCHEQRAQTTSRSSHLLSLRRPPSRPQPFAGLPDVIDFPRHIQPILDQHCVKCHSYAKPDGGIVLTGDHGPTYSHSHWMLISSGQVADGANGYGNRPPRSIGSSASKLMGKLAGGHYEVKVTPEQWRLIWMWIESGATYSGTYASLGCGTAHVPVFTQDKDEGFSPAANGVGQALRDRCFACHAPPNAAGIVAPGKIALPAARLPRQPGRAAYERIIRPNDPILHRSTHILFNLTHPENSIFLLAPLAKESGGWAACKTINPDGSFGDPAPTFRTTADPDYQKFLSIIRRATDRLNQTKRFDMPGFRPNAQYLREMKRYGILPATFDPKADPIDPYQTDRAYWQSLWWKP